MICFFPPCRWTWTLRLGNPWGGGRRGCSPTCGRSNPPKTSSIHWPTPATGLSSWTSSPLAAAVAVLFTQRCEQKGWRICRWTYSSSDPRTVDEIVLFWEIYLVAQICQFAEQNPDVLFLQVNYEEHKSMCYSLHVHVLPFFRFYRGAQGRLCSFSCTNATVRSWPDRLFIFIYLIYEYEYY